ncbi:hypothetical protein SteCoe_24330 [Stentor coeruleus]|uniref:Ubiquitin-like protease family profile domain-containing protein n=1 Tax=Stentor coeruleus TaxID=5963 RepID=A0A1R2BI63_9CILI|nr:hypothetical protein SteCoe_24330 [Stentor coeruleus]
MRPGLSLRIPGIQELSPTRNGVKFNSLSISLSKPPSPRPSEGKNHHRTTTHSSPYSRITSGASIKKLALPSFLRISHESRDELLNKLPLGKTAISQGSECPTDTSSIQTLSKEQHCPSVRSTPAPSSDEFIDNIFEKGLSKEELLLKVGKIALSRGDLQSLHPQAAFTRNVIDACLRCIKHKNRKLFKSAESHDRVLIINTTLSQHIFNSTKDTKLYCQRNSLKYEYVLFPIYIGYWTLLALDNRQKNLQLYNMRKNDTIIEQIVICVKDFIRRELKHHEQKEIEVTGWRELSYEVIECENIEESDCAAFAIRIAYKVAINNRAALTIEILDDFRYNLLIMLYKHGNQNFQ